MAGDYEFSAEGLGQLELLLGTMVRKLGNLTPLMLNIGSTLVESTVARFSSQTGPDGRRWKPSVQAQLKSRQTLVDSTRLRESVVRAATADSVEVGTNVRYAATHQFGRDKAETIGAHNRLIDQAFGRPLKFGVWQSVREHQRNPNIPARPFLGLDAEDVAALARDTYDYLGGPGVLAQLAA